AHPEQLEMVRDRVSALTNVTLALDVPLPEVDRFFARAKILVNTSTYEGFPNTFVQAALHGAPILSWTVDPDRVLTTQQIGLCAGGSFECLVEAVGRLCADESARRALADRAREYARRHHDLNRTVAEFKALIRSLHEGHRTTPDGCAVSQDLWRG
ncbi:MAG: glycosyltransferase, partial [Nitrospirales bacterium]